MNVIDHLRRQFAYDEWANQEVVSAMHKQGADARSLELMAHIIGAERVWLDRLRQQPQSSPVWPKADLPTCRVQVAEMGGLWREHLDQSSEVDLPKSISYKNSKGEVWSSTVVDILTHVLMHSAYHRGQIASHMRESGQTPAYTDFIHGVRQGLVG